LADSLDLVFLQCWVGLIGLIAVLWWRQTAFMGVTCLFAFQVSSAGLSSFFFGRLFGLREQWITAEHEKVFSYSGWALIAIVAAMWLAWLPSKKDRAKDSKNGAHREMFPWVTERFVYFSLSLGAISSVALPFVYTIPTVGTAAHLLTSWLKFGLIAAVILFKKNGAIRPLLIAVGLYLPAGMVYALSTGHTPLSMDAIVPIALIATCYNRVNLLSFGKLILWMIPCVYLMFAWMASRNAIRSGELEMFSLAERASRFTDIFVDELIKAEVTPYDIQNLLFDRIDMSDILAQETAFQNAPSGEDEFEYGGTLIDGAIAVVPRAIWEDKPIVAGYADFVGRFTGVARDDNTSIGVPVQFELYANGGAPWVIVGVFILFYLCARLERFIAFCDRPLHTLMPSLVFLMGFASGIEQIMLVLSTVLAGAIPVFVIALIIEWFFPKFLPQFRVAPMRRQFGGPVAATG
jgi:hypothetical protein